ncbi:hypothetical protein EDB80DRAFT_95008 [Ilyonectria destructans]|nr:hypothetical protein EDB80DRAFT_95008 [Ilyonectria destructans]
MAFSALSQRSEDLHRWGCSPVSGTMVDDFPRPGPSFAHPISFFCSALVVSFGLRPPFSWRRATTLAHTPPGPPGLTGNDRSSPAKLDVIQLPAPSPPSHFWEAPLISHSPGWDEAGQADREVDGRGKFDARVPSTKLPCVPRRGGTPGALSERPLTVGRPLLVLGLRIWLAESFARLKSTAAGRAGWNGSETTGSCRRFTGGRSRVWFCGDDAAAAA